MKSLTGGTVYSLSIHLVFVTKYRKKVIDAAMLVRLKEIFALTCSKWECELCEFNEVGLGEAPSPNVLPTVGEEDHCHLLVEINPKVLISSFANNLKTVSSRLIRKEFPDRCAQFYKKAVFWKIGYFVSSTGGANLETIKRYIQNQDTP
ncbi:MAG: IS200/IS605 family transposase [Hydrococcus sp. RM1_1_31]|nr:IS200/IS605 family transposase [Hydrococcus sp. RM1_1_31]